MAEYIDKEELIKAIYGELDYWKDSDNIKTGEAILKAFIKYIAAFNTVKKPPLKSGRWIETAFDYYTTWAEKNGPDLEMCDYFTDNINFACSECFTQYEMIDGVEHWGYCPFCGSKNT